MAEAEFGPRRAAPAALGRFRVAPRSIEFWYGAQFRLHERHLYERDAWEMVEADVVSRTSFPQRDKRIQFCLLLSSRRKPDPAWRWKGQSQTLDSRFRGNDNDEQTVRP